jgi:hypothetical protein
MIKVGQAGQVSATEQLAFEPLQLLPAEAGWEACFREDDGSVTADPVVMWALCRVLYGDARDIGNDRLPNSVEPMIMADEVGEGFSSLSLTSDASNYLGVRRKIAAT